MKKILFSMLALLLAMGGAWAQGPTAAEINADLYSGWSSMDDELFKASELPGFQAVTEDQAKSWTGVPSTGVVKLYYEFVADGHVKYVSFQNGVYAGSYEENEFERYFIYEDIEYNGDIRYFYTTGGGAIKLTPDATGKVWTLAETPDYDLDLQVVYYQRYALKEIPANWQVKVDGVDKTAAIDGDSLKISETAQVLLTPDHPEYVKSVRLVDVMKSLTIAAANDGLASGDAKTIEYVPGETWAQVAARYSWLKATEYGVYYDSDCGSNPCGDLKYIEGSQNNGVNPTDLVDPEKSYIWGL